MEDKLAKLRKTANNTLFSEKRFNEEQKRKVFQKVKQKRRSSKVGVHRLLTAVFIICFLSFTGYLLSNHLNSDPNTSTKEQTFQTEEPSNSLEKQTVHLQGPFDPEVPPALPEEPAPAAGIEGILNVNETELTGENTSIDLNMNFEEGSEEVVMTGFIKIGDQSISVKGTGWVVPVKAGNETYYYASLDMAYRHENGSQQANKEKLDLGKGGGIFYIDPRVPHEFRGTVTISNSEGAAGMTFGEGNHIAPLIEETLNEKGKEERDNIRETTGIIEGVSSDSIFVVTESLEKESETNKDGEEIIFRLSEVDEMTVSKLKTGQKVRVSHDADFMFSDPAQTSATEIEIIEN